MHIAIVAVAYNRIDSLKRLLNSLERAIYDTPATLIISIDKSKTDIVERFAEEYDWPFGEKIVDKHEKNLGLRPHMMSLGKWYDRFDAIVVLEDDIIVSPSFYYYTQRTVEKYHDCSDIAGISLYGMCINYLTSNPFTPVKDEHDVYFMNSAISWGEVWMKEQWNAFYEWYLNNLSFERSNQIPDRLFEWGEKSWLKYHTRYCIEQNKFFVFPYVSLSSNSCDSGTNSKYTSSEYQVPLQKGLKKVFSLPNIGEATICYDGFFENKALYQKLGLGEDECCIDINGTKRNRFNKRFWLTTTIADYKIVQSYGLQLRPIEMNVLEQVVGNLIFLYDTSIPEKNPHKTDGSVLRYYYHIGSNMYNFVFKRYGFKKLVSDVLVKVFTKIRSKIR
jgi:hypothetical protein